MMFALGVIVGVLVCVFIVVLNMLYRKPLERMAKQFEARLQPKGKLLEPDDNPLKSWLDELPETAKNEEVA